MKKLLLICMLFVGLVQMAFAQRASMDEVVYLKNGSIIRGIIVEQVPNKSLKIRTADGSIFVFDMDEVRKITKEPVNRNYRDPYRQSVMEESDQRSGRTMGMVQFFGVGYQDSYEDNYTEGAAFLNINFVYGYQFRNRIFVGGGVGMEHLIGDALPDDYNLRIPVFAAAKVNLNNKRVSPFFQLDAGYHFNTDDYTEDGLFIMPKVGLDFNMGWSKRKALFLSLSTVEYGMVTFNDYNGYYYSNSGYELYLKLGLNFGLRF